MAISEPPNQPNLVYRLKATVHGRVQGVGFRYFTRLTARRLGLTGWVRNDPDGTVRVLAEGTHDQLADFVAALQTGPPGSRIDEVSFEQHPVAPAHRDFSVQR